MNKNVKTFVTIFCYILAIAAFVTMVINLTHKPAETTHAIIWAVVGVVALGAGVALSRKPRY
jgi:uncharacterized membrane protein YczE